MIKNILGDAGRNWALYMQEEASIGAIGIRDVHDNIMYYIIIILTVVTYGLYLVIKKNIKYKYLNHSTIIEIIWTITPGIILILIAIPSFKLLYTMDEIYKPIVTLKIKGNQWFWNYEISDIEGININFDSYIIKDENLNNGELRLLEVDEQVLLPILTPIRLILTSKDVIHSWFVPSLGIKMDCIPGRLNSASLYILREGYFTGMCAELCGISHGEMPIIVKGVQKEEYISWLLSQSDINIKNFKNIINVFKLYF